MNLPDGVTQETWKKALIFIDKWKPGQRCKVTNVECRHFDQPWFDPGSEESKRWVKEGGSHPPFADHDIPAPEPTDALLMALFKAGLKTYGMDYYERFDYLMRFVCPDRNPVAAIILTAAALA